MTDQFGTGLAHQVFDAHMTRHHHGAQLPTVCGEYLTPAPMIGPVGAPCPTCGAILAQREAGRRSSSYGRDEPIGLRWSLPARLTRRRRRPR